MNKGEGQITERNSFIDPVWKFYPSIGRVGLKKFYFIAKVFILGTSNVTFPFSVSLFGKWFELVHEEKYKKILVFLN